MKTNQDIKQGEQVVIVGISGSLREVSYTRMAVQIALEGAQERDAAVKMLDLRDYDLVFCDGSGDEGERAPGVLRLRQAVSEAHGVILGSPEYHGSFSGVLKNALDLMGFDQFGGKIVGLVGVSGGSMGAVNALNDLRRVARWVHAWVIPQQVSIPEAWNHFDDEGRLDDEELAERLREVGRQVARFAYLHHSEQARQFMALWEQALANPGGDLE
ncbi:MAG TPA: NAD(P)H-dependent oxidoreductase [Caldilineae bacterium]|nr:NAD(P)H-dependent oxidoreductase [Caldilineae bacterium]